MKVEIKETKNETKTYPWIGIDDDGDLCIFVKPGEGLLLYADGHMTLNTPEAAAVIGEHNFKPFMGTIILSN